MKNLIKVFSVAVIIMIIFGCEQTEVELAEPDPVIDNELQSYNFDDLESANGRHSRITMRPVIDPINGDIIVGKSKLLRSGNGVFMNLKTSTLLPDHAFTIWWVIWNFPENCTIPGACSEVDFAIGEAVGVDVMYAAGNISNKAGKSYFAGHLSEGDFSGSINELLGFKPIGLLDSKKAEIHLVVRSHGPIIPGQVEEQISSFDGGCTTFFDPFTEIPDQQGECGDIQFSIYPPL